MLSRLLAYIEVLLPFFRDADWFSRCAYFVSACHREVCDSERLIMINLCWQLYLLTATSASHKLNILKSQLKIEKTEKNPPLSLSLYISLIDWSSAQLFEDYILSYYYG